MTTLKKLFLISISGLLLAGCYHTPKTATPVEQPVTAAEEKAPPETQGAEKNTIIYDDSGFTPKAITVKIGTAVTWKNNGTKMMWVASAVHPTHQELAGFDQLEAAGNESSYSYAFTKQGNWKYHNHVAAGDTGMVIVEE